MNTIFLIRQYFKTHTYGILIANGQQFVTIERPWLDNRSNVSCIPAGRYVVDYLPRSGSGKYQKVWHIKSVSKRSGILIHKGNLASHSKGCIILGSRKGRLSGLPAVLSSGTALVKFNKLQSKKSFNLHIIGDTPC